MNYLESVVYIETLSPTALSPCLERLAAFMEEHGQVQDSVPCIHVAGTNGKGSTVALLDSVLRHAGLKVGRFTGPHLLRWNERFHVDGQPISDDNFARLATRVRDLSEDFGRRHPEFGCLTWFELLCAMAFFQFSESGVDTALLEVGLGGRWDATNVVTAPLASVITNIALDHTQILGETVEQIAREKGGIIKPGVPVVTAATGEALAVLQQIAASRGSRLYHCAPPDSVTVLSPASAAGACRLTLEEHACRFSELQADLALPGSHQHLNALTAVAALIASGLLRRVSAPAAECIAGGFRSVYWPGRFQLIPEHHLVLDGAHNPAGARALRRALDELFPDREKSFVLGCFQNKDVAAYVGNLVTPGDRVFACEAISRRAVYPAAKLLAAAAARGGCGRAYSTVGEALDAALAERGPDGIVVASGSFATVKEAMLRLGWKAVEDGMGSAVQAAPMTVA